MILLSGSNAAAQQGGGANSLITMLILYAVIFGVFYFFAIRPQSKQKKEHDALLTTLEIGDSILTTSGFYGVVINISEEVVVVEFGNDKHCRIPMKKENIVEIDKQNGE